MHPLADHYLKRNLPAEAEAIARQMIDLHPNEQVGHDILMFTQRDK